MDATASDPGYGVEPLLDPYDPEQNVRFGQQYMVAMLKRYGGDREAALVAYNAGPANADKWLKSNRNYASLPQRQETEPYAKGIMRRFNG